MKPNNQATMTGLGMIPNEQISNEPWSDQTDCHAAAVTPHPLPQFDR
jgi:hypothetical protein